MRVHTNTVWQLTDDLNEYILLHDESSNYEGAVALCDRAAQAQAGQAEKSAGATGATYGQTAAGIGGTIIPTLERDVNNAPGLTPTQKNAELVAGEQGAGGATAGVVGQAGLNALRTRNTGATSSVLDDAMRRKAQILSNNALGVEKQNTNLQQQQRAQGLSGLEGLYGTDVGAQLKSMGLQNEDINTEIEAGKSGWLQNVEGVGNMVGSLAKGAGSIMSGQAALNNS